MITYINHNVINTAEGVVAHGCNCQGVMGSGVALAVRQKWPVAFERYGQMVAAHRKIHHPDMSGLLGLSQLVNVGDDHLHRMNSLFVANMFTQDQFGRDGRAYASVDAIRTALTSTLAFCRGADLPLFMPRVGCGLGGLSWKDEVEPVVLQLHQETGVPIYVCDLI